MELSQLDLVYILGTGSQWQNNELKYSLRSVEKFLKVRNIYLIGEKPDWIKNVIHLPFKDNEKIARERRIMEKVLFACNIPDLSENFILFNDDYFLIREMTKVPYYHNGSIKDTIKRRITTDEYKGALLNTVRVSDGNHFDIHYPIIYNKERFKDVMEFHDWEKKNGYVVKTLYCNTLKIEGQFMYDCKINRKLTREQIIELIQDREMFSIGDRGLNMFMKELLQEIYPKKSRYEV